MVNILDFDASTIEDMGIDEAREILKDLRKQAEEDNQGKAIDRFFANKAKREGWGTNNKSSYK